MASIGSSSKSGGPSMSTGVLQAARSAETSEVDPALSQLIVSASPSGTVVFDKQGTISYANPALERLLEYPSGGLAGVALESVIRWQVQSAQLIRPRGLLD